MKYGSFGGDIGPVEVLFLIVTLSLAGIHLYLGLFAPDVSDPRSGQFLLIGIAFVGGFLIRLTPLWQPILYLLGAAFAVFLGVLWLFGSEGLFAIGIATGVVATTFMTLALYLFFREESRATSA